jgi:hypothetical protein
MRFGMLSLPLNDADWKFNLPEQALNAVLADADELCQRDGKQRTVTIMIYCYYGKFTVFIGNYLGIIGNYWELL